jgi:hypothetical protein
MTVTEQSLLAAIRDLEAAARAMPTANPKPSLLPLFARIEALERQLPQGTDPRLLHVLQSKSYEKARLLLEGNGGDAPSGSCGR